MDENTNEIIEGIELTDDMLESINGGFALPSYHKTAVRDFVAQAKEEDWDLEKAIEHIRTRSTYASNPVYLDALCAYAREVW